MWRWRTCWSKLCSAKTLHKQLPPGPSSVRVQGMRPRYVRVLLGVLVTVCVSLVLVCAMLFVLVLQCLSRVHSPNQRETFACGQLVPWSSQPPSSCGLIPLICAGRLHSRVMFYPRSLLHHQNVLIAGSVPVILLEQVFGTLVINGRRMCENVTA